jgi:integrase/recombinase XerD
MSAEAASGAKTAQLLARYETDLGSYASPRTVEAFVASVRIFLSWLDTHGVALSEVRPADLEAWRSALQARRRKDGRPYAASTQYDYLVALKNFFRFLVRHCYLLHDPAASLELPRRERRLPRVIYSPSEVKRIIEAASGETPRELRDRALVETLYATGLRVGELTKLTPYDVDFEERVCRVVMGKGRRDRRVPLTAPAAEAIERYLDFGRARLLGPSRAPYLFLGDKGGYLHRAVVGRMLRGLAKRAGVRKPVACHGFRHSVATHLLKRGADIRHIQALLGHACLSTTQIYTQVELSDLRRVLTRAHPRGR